ncbi:MAG: ATP-binding protein [Deltaproteobacteria bacterium]|nr:ATP-binding protein [Deltaproteobacteria bacterium]
MNTLHNGIPEQDRYTRMRRMVFLCMIVAPVIPFILVLGIGYYQFTASLESGTLATVKRIVEDHREMIDSFLSERRGDLEFILRSYPFEELSDTQKLFEIFNDLRKKSNAFVDLGLFNEEGIHLVYHGPFRLVGRDYREEEWFRQVMRDGAYISDVFLGFRRVPHFIIALKRTVSERSWVLRATIDTHIFNEMVKKVRIGRTGEAYLVNSEGLFQTDRRSGGTFMEKGPESPRHPATDSGTKISLQKDASGEEYLYATTWLTNKQWLLVVRQQKADAFRSLRYATYLILLIMVLGGATITALAYTLTGRIIQRMRQIDTEKQQLGQQLVRATRLAELGQMAAGFAHEINNPLQIMKSDYALIKTIFSDLKKSGDLKESEDLRDLESTLDQLKLQVDRCARITQTILKFGRQSEPVVKDVDLAAFIPEVVAMIARKAAVQGIGLKQEISEQTPTLRFDPSQLQQVLLNLLNNAVDAITERHGCDGGVLSVRTGPDRNGGVKISVADNGAGISPENLKKVFTPFFTTKPPGQGTGLGLSVCYGIIDAMGGTMEVESAEGVGTTFTVRLPPRK